MTRFFFQPHEHSTLNKAVYKQTEYFINYKSVIKILDIAIC